VETNRQLPESGRQCAFRDIEWYTKVGIGGTLALKVEINFIDDKREIGYVDSHEYLPTMANIPR
jgi:hypothetical protein